MYYTKNLSIKINKYFTAKLNKYSLSKYQGNKMLEWSYDKKSSIKIISEASRKFCNFQRKYKAYKMI